MGSYEAQWTSTVKLCFESIRMVFKRIKPKEVRFPEYFGKCCILYNLI